MLPKFPVRDYGTLEREPYKPAPMPFRTAASMLRLPAALRSGGGPASILPCRAFPLQSREDHIQDLFLAALVFVQHSKATAHRKPFVQIVGIASREDDDPVLVHSPGNGVRKDLG